MSLIKEGVQVNAVAVYRNLDAKLIGVLYLDLLNAESRLPRTVTTATFDQSPVGFPVFTWAAKEGFTGNAHLFPSRSELEPPGFLADYLTHFCGESKDVLTYASQNHTATQLAFTLLACDRTDEPEQTLPRQVVHLLQRGAYVPGRILELTMPWIPAELQERAVSLICASRTSVVAHAIVLDKKLWEQEREAPTKKAG